MLTSRAVILAGGEGRKSEVIRTVVIVWIKKSLAAWSSVREGCVTCGNCKLYVIAVSCGQFYSIIKVVDPCVLLLCGDVPRWTSIDRDNKIGGGQK